MGRYDIDFGDAFNLPEDFTYRDIQRTVTEDIQKLYINDKPVSFSSGEISTVIKPVGLREDPAFLYEHYLRVYNPNYTWSHRDTQAHLRFETTDGLEHESVAVLDASYKSNGKTEKLHFSISKLLSSLIERHHQI